MVAVDPTVAESRDATAWDAADGSVVTDFLTCATDDELVTACVKQGKDPDDIVRVEFPGLSAIAVGDTVSFNTVMLHNYVTAAFVPYSSASGVDTGNKITVAAVEGGNTTFTLTAGFIAALFDQGSGTWAARFVEDLEIDGDVSIREVDSDLTVVAAVGETYLAVRKMRLLNPILVR